jgi:hypothetical protein
MKTVLLWLTLIACGPAVAQTVSPSPLANDNFAKAATLRGTFIESSIWLTNATIEVQEPFADTWPSRTAWYRWSAPGNGVASFSVLGAGGGKINAAVYYGDWPNLRLITASSGPDFTLRFPVAGQQDISIQIGGRPADCCNSYAQEALWSLSLQTSGSILEGLHIDTVATVEADQFSHAIPLVGEQVSAISYPLWEEHAPLRPEAAGLNNSWYSWTAPHTGKVTVKCITPWPYLQSGITPLDSKIFGVFTGDDPANRQTYRISTGKQTASAYVNWIITTIFLEPEMKPPLSIERAVRIQVQTAKGSRYQVQASQDLTKWVNLGNSFEGTGEPVWIYEPTVPLKEALYRIAIQNSTQP